METQREVETTSLAYYNPTELNWDVEGHVRSSPAQASDGLRRNIEELGRLIEPIHARRVDGELYVVDGWRRVRACEAAGIDVATIVYDELGSADALAKSLTLHTSCWKKVSRIPTEKKA